MTPDERYDAWRDAQLEQYRLENAQLRGELEAVARALDPVSPPKLPAPRWDRVPFPRQHQTRRRA